jgi:hypothetical protein
MSNILLVEPDYRSKFPPLGLMRISSYHKDIGDTVTFVRGKVAAMREAAWHRIYVSSLFTWELPRTVATIRYYQKSVQDSADIYVGGIGVTLLPSYVREHVRCNIIEGALDSADRLGPGTPPLASYVPDYDLLNSVSWKYQPENAYFCKITCGCIRKCSFCAVPRLEPSFGYMDSLKIQLDAVKQRFGERQNLVILDNNVLAIDGFKDIIQEIRNEGFMVDARRDGRMRTVDFNQGIDARLITPEVASLLKSICLSPVRLAFDSIAVEKQYRAAVQCLANVGFREFTNYVLFNFKDDPASLYHRLKVNIELSTSLGIRVTGFPMKYVPMDDVNRHHIAPDWRWRYLRGIQCILLATHGLVSPNPDFFAAAFGESVEEFLEIVTMPDRFIIYRNRFKDTEAAEWRKHYRKLSDADREEFLSILNSLHESRDPHPDTSCYSKFKNLLSYYYPDPIEGAVNLPLF